MNAADSERSQPAIPETGIITQSITTGADVRIGIIGGGFMGEAFLRGILRANLAQPADIAVAELAESRRTALSEHGVRLSNDAQSVAIGADLVLLAVKPTTIERVAEEIRGALSPEAVVISIAAGVRLADVQRATVHRSVVRVMPNLPVAIGSGAVVYLPAEEVTTEQLDRVRAVLDAVATAVVQVDSDDAVDLATALHGSGPAYIYLVIEAMVEAGVRLGMQRAQVTDLVLATVAGAAEYAQQSGQHPAELRNAVTSPGGTTAAALAELESAGVRAAFDEAIDAAYARAQELGDD